MFETWIIDLVMVVAVFLVMRKFPNKLGTVISLMVITADVLFKLVSFGTIILPMLVTNISAGLIWWVCIRGRKQRIRKPKVSLKARIKNWARKMLAEENDVVYAEPQYQPQQRRNAYSQAGYVPDDGTHYVEASPQSHYVPQAHAGGRRQQHAQQPPSANKKSIFTWQDED